MPSWSQGGENRSPDPEPKLKCTEICCTCTSLLFRILSYSCSLNKFYLDRRLRSSWGTLINATSESEGLLCLPLINPRRGSVTRHGTSTDSAGAHETRYSDPVL